MEKLKTKFKIESNFDFVMIMLVFSLSGTSILFEKKYLFSFLGVDNFNIYTKIIIYIVLILPLYNLNLFVIGNILGQGKFFNRYILNFLRKIKLLKT